MKMRMNSRKILSSIIAIGALMNVAVVEGACAGGPEAPKCVNPLTLDDSNNNYTLSVGFLLEQVRMTGTQFAYSKIGNALGATALPAFGSVIEPKFKLNWGFTAGAAKNFHEKNWTLNSRFDFLQSTGWKNAVANTNANIIPINLWRDQFFSAIDGDLGVAGAGNSSFRVTYYNLNVDLDRMLYIDRDFTFEPHMGLKCTFIYDRVITQFSGNGSDTAFDPSIDLNSNLVQRVQNTNFWGMGPSMGMDTDWNLFCHISLFFEGSASILLGYAKASDNVTYTAFPSSFTFANTSHLPVLSPALQTLLGFKYERSICRGTQKVIAKLGWDSTFLWNQWSHIDVISESTFNSSLDTFQVRDTNTFGLTGLLFDLAWIF